MSFDKNRFANLLGQAKGNRSINNYGRISNVDPGYISRLLRCLVETPPSAAIITKLAERAHNEITLNDLMLAAGYLDDDSTKNPNAPDWATAKDKRDIKRILEDDLPVMFDGMPVDEEDKQRITDLITGFLWEAKEKNKVTYGRKKKVETDQGDNEVK